MRTVSPSPLLTTALVADAVVSGLVALLQLTAADWLSELLVLPRGLLVETGAFLIAYTILLAVLARSSRVSPALVRVIILGNIAWAAACAALLVTGVLSPSAAGVGFVIVQAIAVLAFATLEYIGLAASESPVARAAVAQ